MDAMIEVQCRSCGRVQLAPEAIDLIVDSERGDATYAFSCPQCHTPERRRATDTIVRMLELGGVEPHMPRHYPEQLDPAVADLPPFTSDDLLDFHRLLASPDWFTACTAATSRRHRS